MAEQSDTLSVQFPIRLTAALNARLEAVAGRLGSDRSRVVRACVQGALPHFEDDVENIGRAEAGIPVGAHDRQDRLTLNEDLSSDVDKVAHLLSWGRQRTLIECVRVGLRPVLDRNRPVMGTDSSTPAAEELEAMAQLSHEIDPDEQPYGREMVQLRRRIHALTNLLEDLGNIVPQARTRVRAMERLAKLRAWPGGSGGGLPYGLQDDEIEWQIQMHEQHGPDATKWPRKQQGKTIARERKAK